MVATGIAAACCLLGTRHKARAAGSAASRGKARYRLTLDRVLEELRKEAPNLRVTRPASGAAESVAAGSRQPYAKTAGRARSTLSLTCGTREPRLAWQCRANRGGLRLGKGRAKI